MKAKKADTVMIDTVPLPEKPFSFQIPASLLKEFKRNPRIVCRHSTMGIPVPDAVLRTLAQNPDVYEEISENFEVMLIPK